MGRQQFEMTVAQLPREKLKKIVLTQSDNIAAGDNDISQILSSPNTISRVVSMFLFASAPLNATSGTHQFYLYIAADGPRTMIGTSAFGDAVCLDCGYWFTATDAATYPTSPIEVQAAVSTINFDDVTPLEIRYNNDTDVVQTAGRDIVIIVIERQVGN